MSAEIVALLDAAAAEHKVRPELARAVAWVESRGNPTVVSSAGAQGVMQLMPQTAQALGVSDPFDPASNIDAGVKYLAQLISRHGSERKGLAAYNWGTGRVASGRAWPASVRSYVDRVLMLADTKITSAPASFDPMRDRDPADPGPVPLRENGAPSPFEPVGERSAQPSGSPGFSQLPGSLLLTDEDVSDLRFALRFVRAVRGGFGELREDFRQWLDSADVRELVSAGRRVVEQIQAELDRHNSPADYAHSDAERCEHIAGEGSSANGTRCLLLAGHDGAHVYGTAAWEREGGAYRVS